MGLEEDQAAFWVRTWLFRGKLAVKLWGGGGYLKGVCVCVCVCSVRPGIGSTLGKISWCISPWHRNIKFTAQKDSLRNRCRRRGCWRVLTGKGTKNNHGIPHFDIFCCTFSVTSLWLADFLCFFFFWMIFFTYILINHSCLGGLGQFHFVLGAIVLSTTGGCREFLLQAELLTWLGDPLGRLTQWLERRKKGRDPGWVV